MAVIALIASSVPVFEIVTLVIPLGLFLVTLAWLGWALHLRPQRTRGDSWPEPPTTRGPEEPKA